MKTIAELKRRIQPGAKVKTIHHAIRVVGYKTENEESDTPERKPIYETVNTDMGVREIASANSVGFSCWTERNGQRRQSFCDWPKSDSVQFEGENRFIVLEPDLRGLYGDMNEAAKTAPKIPVLTYEIL